MLEQTDAPSFTAYKDAILCDIRDFDAERVLLELILYVSRDPKLKGGALK